MWSVHYDIYDPAMWQCYLASSGIEAKTAHADLYNMAPCPPDTLTREQVRAWQHGRIALVLTLAFAGWGWFYPRPYTLVIAVLASCPWLAIGVVARSRGMFTLDERNYSAQSGLGIPFIFPGLILMMRVLQDLQIGWKEAAWLVVAVAAVLTFFALKVDPMLRTRRSTIIWVALLSLPYGYGAGMEANSLLDRSPTITYSKQIMEENRRPFLSPWGPMDNGDELDSWGRFYTSVSVGDSVCFKVRAGAFGVKWYVVRVC